MGWDVCFCHIYTNNHIIFQRCNWVERRLRRKLSGTQPIERRLSPQLPPPPPPNPTYLFNWDYVQIHLRFTLFYLCIAYHTHVSHVSYIFMYIYIYNVGARCMQTTCSTITSLWNYFIRKPVCDAVRSIKGFVKYLQVLSLVFEFFLPPLALPPALELLILSDNVSVSQIKNLIFLFEISTESLGCPGSLKGIFFNNLRFLGSAKFWTNKRTLIHFRIFTYRVRQISCILVLGNERASHKEESDDLWDSNCCDF